MLTANQTNLRVERKQEKEDCSSESSNSDVMADESEDDNAQVNPDLFCQGNYLFLFNDYLNFSKREGFQSDIDLTPQDYLKMKEVNRVILLRFLDRAVKIPGLKGYEAPVKDIFKPDVCQSFDIASKQVID